MNILRGDRVVLQIPLPDDNNLMVGNVYEIANMTETFVIIRDLKTKTAKCAINYGEFEKYFVKNKLLTWTPWQAITDGESIIGFYRTNGKKVQVRNSFPQYASNEKPNKIYRAEASCNKNDEFSLFFGIHLAFARMRKKYLTDKENCLKQELTDISKEKTGQTKLIKTMLKNAQYMK